MERLTLDMEGARRGDLSAASLQLGDDTIAIQRIATMSVEAHEFAPYDTPKNRRAQSLFATFFVASLFFAIMGLAWFALMQGSQSSVVALFIGGALSLAALFCGGNAVRYALRLRRREPYYRLLIGTSDGRQIPLVDDNREVLEKIRDVVKYKMDNDGREVVGDFDLNLDEVNVTVPGRPEVKTPDLKDVAAG